VSSLLLTGAELTGDGIGDIICGWAITSKDGSPMNMGACSALATDPVRYTGDAVAVVIAESKAQARAAAEAVDVSYDELPVAANIEAVLAGGAPQIHENAPGNVIYDWEIGEKDANEAALAGAAYLTEMDIVNSRLSPNPMEPRAAIANYDAAEDHYTLYTTSQSPHVARLVLSASYMDYTMPRADDLFSFVVEHHNTKCTTNPLGIKGCGEAGAIGSPPAIINAITDAINNNDLSMPATPAKVWAALGGAQMAAE